MINVKFAELQKKDINQNEFVQIVMKKKEQEF
jgi:hypothetical protein